MEYALGTLLTQTGEIERGITHLKTATLLNTSHADTYLELGNAKHSLGNVSDAIHDYLTAYRLQPANPTITNNLGNVYAELGMIGKAIVYWKKTFETTPDYHQAHSNYLLALNYQADKSTAEIYAEHIEWETYHSLATPSISKISYSTNWGKNKNWPGFTGF